ncbi:MAG: hypothetical protein OXN94_06835 [Chloroflexota bacterium]|nr:hypothetical protein [Chloroflexota bacterium]
MWKRIQVFSVVVLLMLAIAPLAGASSDCDFSYSNYARAVQLHDMGDYDLALRHYHCALEEDPDDAVIPLLIANVHEDIAQAGAAWSSAASPTAAEILELPPVSSWGERPKPGREQDFEDLIVEETVSSEPLPGFPNPAAAVTSIAIEQSEDRLWHFYASSRITVALVMKRDQTTSENGLVDGDENISPADEFIRQARIFARNLDWTRARIRFEQALDLDPHRVDIRCELGMVYQELGDERAALGQFDIVLTQDPLDACAWSNRDALMQAMRDG